MAPSVDTVPLPELAPGVLPQLEVLKLELAALRTTLPASWGSSPAVLPALRELRLEAQFEGGLPPAWSGGFRRLQQLHLIHTQPSLPACLAPSALPAAQLPGAPAAGPPREPEEPPAGLPPQWALGFPNLALMQLSDLRIGGPFPPSWQTGFPALVDL